MPHESFVHVSAAEVKAGTEYTQSEAYFKKRGRFDTIDPDQLKKMANAVGERMLLSEVPFEEALTDIVNAFVSEDAMPEKEAYRSAIGKIFSKRRVRSARAQKEEADRPFPKRLEPSGQYAWAL